MQEQTAMPEQSLTRQILRYAGFGLLVSATAFGLKELSDAYIWNTATHIIDHLGQLPESTAGTTGQQIMDYVRDNIYKFQHYTNALAGIGIGAGSACGQALSDWRQNRRHQAQESVDDYVAPQD